MTDPHMVEITLQTDDGWQCEKLTDLIAWLQDRLEEIPEASRADAKCNLTTLTSYDGDYAEVDTHGLESYGGPNVAKKAYSWRAGWLLVVTCIVLSTVCDRPALSHSRIFPHTLASLPDIPLGGINLNASGYTPIQTPSIDTTNRILAQTRSDSSWSMDRILRKTNIGMVIAIIGNAIAIACIILRGPPSRRTKR